MNAVLNSGQLPQHTPEFLKERKFLIIMPLAYHSIFNNGILGIRRR